MSIPGFSPAPAGWQSPVPGWVAPATRVIESVSPLRVELDGRVLETGDQSPRNFRDLVDIQGWWDGADVRGDDPDRPGADGKLEGRVLLGARSITVNGHIHVQSRRELLEAMEWYGSVLQGQVRRADLTVTELERNLSRQARVRCVRPPAVVPDGDSWASVLWSLEAADPVRYEVTPRQVRLTPGGADQGIQNVGNALVPLTLRLVGPLVKPILWIDGQQWRLTRDVAAGEIVVAYWKDREVWSGMNSLRFWQSGPWTPARPGMTQVGLSTSTTSSGHAIVSWRSGWL